MNENTITILQACMLVITAIGILDHVIIIPLLLQDAGRDAWISVLLTGVGFIVWIPLIFYIIKHIHPYHLNVWLKERVGSICSALIILSIVLEIFLMGSMTLHDVTYWAKISYMPETPKPIIAIFLCFVSFLSVQSGIRSIAITNGILLPFVILFGFFVMTANFPQKDYTLLTPILENGLNPVFKGMIYAGSGLVGLFVLVFIQQHITGNIRILPIFLTGLILMVLILGPLTGAIAEFGPFEAASLRFPAYEEWRMVTFGHYLEHVDFLSIYQWLVGSFTRISVAMFILADLLLIKNKKKRSLFLLCMYVGMLTISEIPISDMKFMSILKTYYLPFILIHTTVLSLLLWLIIFITKNKEVSK